MACPDGREPAAPCGTRVLGSRDGGTSWTSLDVPQVGQYDDSVRLLGHEDGTLTVAVC